ncbi:uncharacterized protein BJ212DRAFT_452850 [Suillus subaureus]|uniref:Secreted protein n=1 Tax=Suillus subaureus TaxID=48587 RepID=A0A9P7JBD3_9AGAM|nr:uncharacterized protein BJ212DRAFT_452850 [Suillus subaureus]KAG1812499.1 hypothetical protein BJ212DRAFT_452850 [Suillus subaureus]
MDPGRWLWTASFMVLVNLADANQIELVLPCACGPRQESHCSCRKVGCDIGRCDRCPLNNTLYSRRNLQVLVTILTALPRCFPMKGNLIIMLSTIDSFPTRITYSMHPILGRFSSSYVVFCFTSASTSATGIQIVMR